MNRRTFVKSLAAALTLPAAPALPFRTAAAALPTAAPAASAAAQAALATKARFWAIYMHGIQGNCTPATLSAVLNIPEAQARGYVTRLAAEGVIKPHPLVKQAAGKVAKVVDKKAWRMDEGVCGEVEECVEWQWEG